MSAVTDEPDVTVRLTAADAAHNLRIVLETCASGGLRCSEKTRRPAATSVAALASLLVPGDFYPDEAIAAYAWPLLVQAGGLAELVGTRLQLTARGRTALGAETPAAVRDLWRRWVANAPIDELSRIDAIKGQRSANVLTSARTRRETVARALGTCLPGAWVDIEDLFDRMQRRDLSPTVARSERGLWRLYLIDQQYGSLGYEGYHDWSILEGRYTLAVLFEYAATLGLVDVAYTDPVGAREDFQDRWGGEDLDYLSRYDGLRAIRVNALGSHVLGLGELPAPVPAREAAAAAVKVLPNHDVVAVGDLPLGDRLTLSAFAQATGERVWRLTAASLLAGVATGRSLDELLRLLERASGGPVPATVRTLVADVTARTGALADRGVVRLVECADAATAQLVARDRRTRRFCGLLGERHLTVGAEHEVAFRAALAELGYVLPPP